VVAPVVLAALTRVMLRPSGDLLRHFGIPEDVARQAVRSPEGRQLEKDAIAKTRHLLTELGLTRRPARLVWRAMGLWDDRAKVSGTTGTTGAVGAPGETVGAATGAAR
jgi:hypothetical protein